MPSSSEQAQMKNRNFICSCGKAYLSYAALFTHIKQKHDGKAPGEIIRPRSQNKRGRPRKSQKPSADKPLRNSSNNGYLGDNNNSKNINFSPQLNIAPKGSSFLQLEGKGFQSYKGDKQKSTCRSSSEMPEQGFFAAQQQQPVDQAQIGVEQDEAMDFSNPKNQLSSNTLAFTTVIMSLHQLMDEPSIEEIPQKEFQKFAAYSELKRFYQRIIQQKKRGDQDQDIFVIGQIICNFLNFCHNIIDIKARYHQLLLLVLCLIQHLIEKKGSSVLKRCRKQVIQENLPSFCQQYLTKVINKSKFKHWVYRQKNAYKVLGIFLHWLSVVEAQSTKNQEGECKASAIFDNLDNIKSDSQKLKQTVHAAQLLQARQTQQKVALKNIENKQGQFMEMQNGKEQRAKDHICQQTHRQQVDEQNSNSDENQGNSVQGSDSQSSDQDFEDEEASDHQNAPQNGSDNNNCSKQQGPKIAVEAQ